MSVTRPIMRYHGAKFRIAPWVIRHFPPHRKYVELFGGAAGVLAQKPVSESEVYNDLDSAVVNVFRVLRDPDQRTRLIDACVMTPFAREEFDLAYEDTEDPVEAARRTVFRAQAGYGSASATKTRSGFRSESDRLPKTAAHLWAEYPDSIEDFGRRFSGVIIENRPACDVVPAHDSEQTLFYADPPYLHSVRVRSAGGRYYRHEMTDADHEALLATLQQCEGMVVISGYDSEMYRDTLSGWHLYSKNVSIAANKGGGTRIECLWVSPNVVTDQMTLEL